MDGESDGEDIQWECKIDKNKINQAAAAAADKQTNQTSKQRRFECMTQTFIFDGISRFHSTSYA